MNDAPPVKKSSRIQQRNRNLILDAALDVFSKNGFRGATLDQIAEASGLSKPNILYYFSGKEDIHMSLLNQLMDTWLDPLRDLGADMLPEAEPLEEVLRYVRHKLDMAREFPRESRLFANEVLQGAPRMGSHLRDDLRPLVEEKAELIQSWMDAGKLALTNPRHLIISIWSTTQHYADFEAQVAVLMGDEPVFDEAAQHLDTLFRRLLTPQG